jgi:hypothetical protein
VWLHRIQVLSIASYCLAAHWHNSSVEGGACGVLLTADCCCCCSAYEMQLYLCTLTPICLMNL